MSQDNDSAVRCAFYARNRVNDDPTYRYDQVTLRGPEPGRLATPHPPVIGDLIHLPGGTYRVIERAWHHSEWGSVDWPVTQTRPTSGPMLDVIVEATSGPFVDEA